LLRAGIKIFLTLTFGVLTDRNSITTNLNPHEYTQTTHCTDIRDFVDRTHHGN
jgi:hypothetical protein